MDLTPPQKLAQKRDIQVFTKAILVIFSKHNISFCIAPGVSQNLSANTNFFKIQIKRGGIAY